MHTTSINGEPSVYTHTGSEHLSSFLINTKCNTNLILFPIALLRLTYRAHEQYNNGYEPPTISTKCQFWKNAITHPTALDTSLLHPNTSCLLQWLAGSDTRPYQLNSTVTARKQKGVHPVTREKRVAQTSKLLTPAHNDQYSTGARTGTLSILITFLSLVA